MAVNLLRLRVFCVYGHFTLLLLTVFLFYDDYLYVVVVSVLYVYACVFLPSIYCSKWQSQLNGRHISHHDFMDASKSAD